MKNTNNAGDMKRPEKKPRPASGGSHAPRVITIALVVLMCLALFVVGSGFYIKSIKTVYPNVSIAGVDVSGMTYDDALMALIAAGYGDTEEDVSATVRFPNGLEMVIMGKEAGFSLDAREAAQLAVDYGKGGSFLQTEINYVKALLGNTELTHDAMAEMDEDYVLSVVTEYTKKYNESLMNDTFAIASDHIEIVKNAGMDLANVDDVYALTESLVYEAVESSVSLSAEYTPTGGTNGGDIDLLALYNTINVEPVSAEYDPATLEISESVTGVSFDMDAAQKQLGNATSGDRIIIPLIFTEPEVTSESLSAMMYRDVLSEKTTYIDGTSNRLNNVTISANAINGHIMKPGDTFSFNEIVGKRTAERGYKEAGAYVSGKTVQEIGGGICQTSSTLYYCVLYADLAVVERAYHMFTIPYLPLGHDATISWGAIDFKFKNDTDYPVRIETVVDGRNLTVRLVGTKTNSNYVKTEYVVLSTSAYETIKKEDESIAPGTSKVDTDGHNGCTVETYKYVYDENDNLISKTYIAKSAYRKQDRVILVPVGTLEPTESPSVSPSETPSESPSTSPSVAPSESAPPSETPTDSNPPVSESPSEEPTQIVVPEE